MSSGILNEQNKVSEEFAFRGDCYICVRGSGTFSIERRLGSKWCVLTTERGEHLTYTGEGILFNNKINCLKAIPHRIVGDTAEVLEYDILKERG